MKDTYNERRAHRGYAVGVMVMHVHHTYNERRAHRGYAVGVMVMHVHHTHNERRESERRCKL